MSESKHQRTQQEQSSNDQSQISLNLALGGCVVDTFHLNRNKVTVSHNSNRILSYKWGGIQAV